MTFFCKGMRDYIQIYLNGKSNPIVTLKSLNAGGSCLGLPFTS